MLDVSCGEGFLAAELLVGGNRVTGIDALPEASRRDALSDYYSVDLNSGLETVVERLKGKRFDRILLLDILEHLYDPERIVAQCHALLADDGEVIVSLPNVANISVRLMLLFGKFNYSDRGIMDRTHLRWYTRRTARQLLQEAGYRIVAEKVTVVPIALALGLSPQGFVFGLLNFCLGALTRMLPTLLGYQIMLVGRRDRIPPAPAV